MNNNNTRDLIRNFEENNPNIKKILNLDNTILEYMSKFTYASRTNADNFLKITQIY